MNRSDQEKLLGKIFSDERLEQLRSTSLLAGLAVQQRRRTRRKLVAGLGAACALLAAVAVISRHHAMESSAPLVDRTSSPLTPPAKLEPVQEIDDQQLLTLFSQRTPALVGPPENERLVFGDSRQ